ncbi:MAG: NAD(P)/FAD-dependent oxidoreductase [Candidatus Bathyarchaeota archaeon]|nr:MAG: NAD(P)/FAD-dependent oxidoreductase [Candidatus Bathyarchaeota archaeon]
MKKSDVVVVGAGTAGCLAAKTVADAGLKVCLFDRKERKNVGEKVCGDAVGKHHFDNLGLDYPSGDELERTILGAKIFSPNTESVFSIKGEGLNAFSVNRYLFGQRLLRNAIDAGSTFFESTQALEPAMKNGFVAGVSVRDLKTGSKTVLHSQVVVDASGFSAVIRKKLPPKIGVDTDVDKRDVELCYREIRELKEQIDDADFCEIYLSQTVAPGGYCWIFPKNEKNVNVGVGVAMREGFPNPKKQLYNNVLSKPLFDGSKIVGSGTWYDPARRPLDCMTGNGVVMVGDSACQVNPIHGGGIGPSMMGGALAGKTIIEAMEKGDVSREGLWLYNARYMQSYGAKQAGLDVLRLLLQKVGDDSLNYVMKYRLITQEDVLKTSMGEDLRLNITETTRRVFRGLRKLSFLRELRHAASLLKRVKVLYSNYPTSPKDFDEWRRKARDLIEEASG